MKYVKKACYFVLTWMLGAIVMYVGFLLWPLMLKIFDNTIGLEIGLSLLFGLVFIYWMKKGE